MRLLLHFICMAGTGIIISMGRCGKTTWLRMTSRECYSVAAKRIWYSLRYGPAVIAAVKQSKDIAFSKIAKGRNLVGMQLRLDLLEMVKQIEETRSREAEEVGVKVKNITYYKSQPWDSAVLSFLGYFCELDGDDTITLEEDES